MGKRCISCTSTKPLAEFYKHPGMADGHLNKCKACCKKQATEHREKNLDRVREYDRQRGMLPHRVEARRIYQQTEAGRTAHAAAVARWQALQPLRRAANTILGNAVRDGRVRPWPVCAVPECKRKRVEGHHPDYDRPLDVVWLCSQHHRECHKLFTGLMP